MLHTVITPGAMTAKEFLYCFGMALLLGLGCMLLTRFKNRCTGTMALAVAVLPSVVMLMIMLVNKNLGMGLAVGGIFALVRFRSVPGNARDIAQIFLACALGVACGQGYLLLALVFFAVLALVILGLSALKLTDFETRKRLKITVPENLEYEGLFDDLLSKYAKEYELVHVKSTGMGTLYELEYLLSPKGEIPKAMLDEIRCRNGNLKVSLGPADKGDEM